MSLFGDDVVYDEEDRKIEDAPLRSAETKLAPPQSNPLKFGHQKQEQLFLNLFEKGTLPHAMIFAGPHGVGKTTMAFRLARFLLKYGVESEPQDSLFGEQPLKLSSLDIAASDPVFARVASGGHPDFRYIERIFDTDKGKQDSALKVETLRKIEPFLRMKSSNGGWRVVIIEDADTMNRNAQNTILKILEEPPPKVLMILIAHRLGALIPTIRSRARVIPFAPLEDDVLRDLLARQGYSYDKTEMDLLLRMAGGSIGQAIRLAEEGGITILKTLLDYINDPKFPNWVAIHELSQQLSPAAQDKEYRLFTEMMQWIFRQILFARAKGAIPPAPLNGVKQGDSLEKLIKICDELKNLFDRTDFSNLDRRDAVRASFLVINQ